VVEVLISECDPASPTCRFMARPNCSLSGHDTAVFFLAVSAVALAVAVRFFLLGAWLVLPVTLLEVVALGIAFAVVARRARYLETIDVDEAAVFVIRRDWRSQHEWRFQPYWVRVVLQPDSSDWYPSRLYLRSHGRTVEIGRCLTNSERAELFEGLGRRLERHRNATH
jgi:uncharacterized membrane protein